MERVERIELSRCVPLLRSTIAFKAAIRLFTTAFG
jgi:hypothetical protein